MIKGSEQTPSSSSSSSSSSWGREKGNEDNRNMEQRVKCTCVDLEDKTEDEVQRILIDTVTRGGCK